jgi:molybdopterin/thiamine biosynthesis adenylyltransferase
MSQSTQNARFKDAPWFPKDNEFCLVGGAGGIGSWLTFFLSKIGFRTYLYDFDTVEDHNLGGQLFQQHSIGRPKVSAVATMIQDFCSAQISIFNQEITLDTPTHWFCFSAFDNMKARKTLFEVWKRSWRYAPEGVIPIFIDGRLEIEQLQVLCVTPDNADRYEELYLFDDSVVEEAPCTMKQSSHTAAMIGSIMTSYFTNHIANIYARETIREVPFYYEFVVPMNYSYSEL